MPSSPASHPGAGVSELIQEIQFLPGEAHGTSSKVTLSQPPGLAAFGLYGWSRQRLQVRWEPCPGPGAGHLGKVAQPHPHVYVAETMTSHILGLVTSGWTQQLGARTETEEPERLHAEEAGSPIIKHFFMYDSFPLHIFPVHLKKIILSHTFFYSPFISPE